MGMDISERETLVFTLLETADRLERRLDRTLSNTRGITFREFLLLRALSRSHQQSATRVDLASAVGLTPSAVTRALRPLEKLGYVVTHKSDRDARRSLAVLTSQGHTLLQDAQGAVNDLLVELTLEPADAVELLDFLHALARR